MLMSDEIINKIKINRVILITVDSLRADYDMLDNVRDVLFENVGSLLTFKVVYSNGPGTSQSFPSIMSSTPFLVHGDLRLKDGIPTLAEVLSQNGFYTIGFHSNPFLSRRFGWDRGFMEFYDFLGRYRSPAGLVVSSSGWKRFLINVLGKLLEGSSKKLWSIVNRVYYRIKGFNLPYIEARELNNYVLEWIRKNNNKLKRVFLWIHYMDVHFPFAPPDEYLSGTGFSNRREAFFYNYRLNFENPNPEIVSRLKKLYEASVRYVADNIAHLLEELSRYSLLDDSLVIITSDHGEAFLEHGKFGHAYDILYNEVLRVPLIIGGTFINSKRQIYDRPIQLMDLAPTIIDLIRAKKPIVFKGKSLARVLYEGSETNLYPIFSESAIPDLINLKYDTSRYIVSVVLGRWKLILDLIHSSVPMFELYDLAKDPNEKHNLFEEHKDVANDLIRLINLHLDNINKLKKFVENVLSLRLRLRKSLCN